MKKKDSKNKNVPDVFIKEEENLEKFLVDFLNGICKTKTQFKKLNEIVGKKIEIRCSVPAGKQNGGIFKVEKFFSYLYSSEVSYVLLSSEKPAANIITDIGDGLVLVVGFSSNGYIQFDGMESGTKKKKWQLVLAGSRVEIYGKLSEDYLQISIFD